MMLPHRLHVLANLVVDAAIEIEPEPDGGHQRGQRTHLNANQQVSIKCLKMVRIPCMAYGCERLGRRHSKSFSTAQGEPADRQLPGNTPLGTENRGVW